MKVSQLLFLMAITINAPHVAQDVASTIGAVSLVLAFLMAGFEQWGGEK